MKVLRALYVGAILLVGSPIIVLWIIGVIGFGLYVAVRYKESPITLFGMIPQTLKWGVWLYGNWIKYGNSYNKYPLDEVTL